MKHYNKLINKNCSATNRWSSAKGNITVEAAFVMPIILCAIFTLLYLTFYLHDKSKMQAMVDESLYKAGLSIKYGADIDCEDINIERFMENSIFLVITGYGEEEEKAIEKYLEDKLIKGFFLLRVSSIEVTVSRTNISIVIDAKAENMLPLLSYLLQPLTQVNINNSFSIHDPAETIRGAEVILETGDKIKGIHKLLEFLKNGLN